MIDSLRINVKYVTWILDWVLHSRKGSDSPQGSPMSPVLYIFYNADLVEEIDEEPTDYFGYIDDS